MKQFVLILVFLGVVTSSALSQEVPDPQTAFLKSMVIPGWGHYYVDKSNWERGRYHIAAEGVVFLSFLGFNIHSKNLEQNWFTYAKAEAGVDIESRSRSFRLAVGEFNNLEAYNNYQEQSRNWDRILDDQPENRWNWGSSSKRFRYNDLRSRFERIEQQLPALIGLMVVNRVISGISAYNQAKKKQNGNSMTAMVRLLPVHRSKGIVARLSVHF